mgnify:CR=1 FL=1
MNLNIKNTFIFFLFFIFLFLFNYIYYYINDGNWNTLLSGQSIIINTDDKIYFKAELTPTTNNGIGTFTISNYCNLSGNIMSLLYGDDFENYDFETLRYIYGINKPVLGICLGMQMAVVEFARNVLGIKDANSAEFDENVQNPVIHIMEEQKAIMKKGGTMRLGAYDCHLKKGSVAAKAYGATKISERHRHRYEVNNEYINYCVNSCFSICNDELLC